MAPRGRAAMSGDIFACHYLGVGGRLLLVSSGYTPGMLVNILQCTGCPTENYLAPNINSAEVEKPSPRPGVLRMLGRIVKTEIAGPQPQRCDSVVWRGAFLTSSQVTPMLGVQG